MMEFQPELLVQVSTNSVKVESSGATVYQRNLGVSTLLASVIFLFYAWYFMTLGHRIAYLIA